MAVLHAVLGSSDGEVVGLLTSGQNLWDNTKGYAFVTPIEDVFGDIIECTRYWRGSSSS